MNTVDTGVTVQRVAEQVTALWLRANPTWRWAAEDLRGHVTEAACRAAAGYEDGRGATLATYVSRRAQGAVLDWVRDRSPLTRTEHERGLTIEELPAWRRTAVSVEALIEAGTEPADARDFTDEVADRLMVEQLLRACTDRERDVLVACVLEGRSQADMAREWGCSTANVAQIKRRALARLAGHPGLVA